MAYVYRHIRLDTNVPFYIGVGIDANYFRAYQKTKSKRSAYWLNIIKKTAYTVDILIDDISVEISLEKEKEFISLYGRADLGTGSLVNLTDGGENPPIHTGDSNPMKKPENRAKISALMTGIKRSDYTCNLLRERNIKNGIMPPNRKGEIMSKEGRDKMVKTRMQNGVRRKAIFSTV